MAHSHAQDVADDAATDALIRATVAHQSDSENNLDAAVRAKAGWDAVQKKWTNVDPLPVTFRMKATGKIITSGHEKARHAVLSGVADLV
jgi:hypothetical protein